MEKGAGGLIMAVTISKIKISIIKKLLFESVNNTLTFDAQILTMKLNRLFLIIVAIITGIKSFSQVTTTIPVFPNENDTVTVFYHSDQGNGALDGVIPIYAHTGVITSNSSSDTDWQHVVGNWGTPDPEVLMTYVSPNLFKIVIPIQEFYGIDDGEEVFRLAFVFRNGDGSIVGRNADGSDIFVELHNDGSVAVITTPSEPLLVEPDDVFPIVAQSITNANLTVFIDDITVAEALDDTIVEYEVNVADYGTGTHQIKLEAVFTDETQYDSTYFTIISNPEIIPVPEGIKEGINIDPNQLDRVTFNLFAPGKQHIYLLGDFNNWQVDANYLLNNDPSGDFHWIEITGLDPEVEYGFQYFILEDNLRFADPYSQKILDPWNDQWIAEETYPNLKPYPVGLTTGIVGTFQTNQPVFEWTDENYVQPDENNLIVYELLVRDFLAAHDYATLIDTLDYLETLGVKAIELMPVNEFEGNISWGYNPDYYFTPDKYYGPKQDYQAFIDACHERGMAVIMDIALNHSFGLNPQVMMYFDPSAGPYGQPTADNPWFNEIPKHDFNVGYDYNHESPYTKIFVDSVFVYWVQEFHVDGYRLDLSKGYTQNNTLGDVNAWGQYDQSRINILTNYANHVWSDAPESIFILEHFAVNSEETVLSDAGFLLWGNLNNEYLEASMGYTSNLTWGSYQARGWNDPHLLTYMESHDEERMMYKNITYGNSQGDYDVTDPVTALKRSELATVFFLPVPGPKMIWQFGEMGYDFSINTCEDGSIDEGCRISPKPIHWEYMEDANRKHLFDVYQELIRVKKEYPVFSTDDFSLDVTGFQKTIHLNDQDMNVVVIGNFGMIPANMEVSFKHGDYWYDLFTGDSLLIESDTESIDMQAGEYRLYTDVKIGDGIVTGIEEYYNLQKELVVYPNPSDNLFNIILPETNSISTIEIYSADGRQILSEQIAAGSNLWQWIPDNTATRGMYFIRHTINNQIRTQKVILK